MMMCSRCRPDELGSGDMLSPNLLWRRFLGHKLCKIGNVLDGILVGDGPSVQCTIVVRRSPTVIFLRDKVEGRSPGAIGTPGGSVSQHLELGFRYSEVVWC
jgi:hypothetical protein